MLVPFALPGNWLMVIFAFLFEWRYEGSFNFYTLAAIVTLAAVGEVAEFLGGFGGARKGGARWFGAVGAIIGGICGAIIITFLIPIPVFGTLFGACVGAGIGAWAFEIASGRAMDESVRLGFGAGIGQFIGLVAKMFIGVIIYIVIAAAVFWT